MSKATTSRRQLHSDLPREHYASQTRLRCRDG